MFKRKWYWFSVTLKYVSKEGILISERTTIIGKKRKRQILKNRDTAAYLGKQFISNINPTDLCNGSIGVEVNAYLGRMSNPNEK